jgi:hypothetical protein
MKAKKEFTGRCFCGAVELRVEGDPAAMGYCHCSSCRVWSAGPVNAFTLWPIGAVTVTRGAELLRSYEKTPKSKRQWCASCGGHLMTEHPELGLTDVYAAVLQGFPFDPKVHVNYSEATLHVRDGLPKLSDLPQEMGGSGATLPE